MVLVIEDDESTRETTARILRLEGFTVLTATDGREALALLATERPALIICDLTMPNVDGWTFRRIQLGTPAIADIPFVVATACVDVDERDVRLGAASFLRKPVTIEDIVRCAQEYDLPTRGDRR